jgi:uncharacterized protein (TIGR00255 family)
MTGFGRSESKVNSYNISVEIKSVNSKFCEIFVKMPAKYTIQEELLKDIIKENLKRGKIDALVEITGREDVVSKIFIDEDKLKGYLSSLKKIKEKYKLGGEISIQNIIEIEDIFAKREEKEIIEKLWEDIKKALMIAIKNILNSRKEEGKFLENDLKNRINTIKKNLKYIEKSAQIRNKLLFNTLKKKVNALIQGIEKIDRERLEFEVALLSEKYDITEECVRLNHHNEFFLNVLKEGGEVGKKLDFIIQEMAREVNTIGAKGNSYEISKFVISIKEELEKLKEQVRNIV